MTPIGLLFLPRAVEVSVHPRREPSNPYWRGSLAEPAVADGGFFLQKLVNHYRSPPLPFPERTPPYRVRFEMHLVVEHAGAHEFELDSPWYGAVDIDGVRVFGMGPFGGASREGSIDLRAGVHRVVMSTQPVDDPDQPMRLLWKEPGGRLRPVVRGDLTVPGAERVYSLSAWLASPLVWVGTLLFGLATLLWVFRAGGTHRTDLAIALALVMGLAFLARAAHFDTYPRTNGDESHNAWAGFNLIHEGHPRSWSWIPIYDNTRVMWFSYSYPIVPVSFDHPPFLPLLVGMEATLLGAEDMFDCVLPRIRPLMLLLGTLSVGLLFLVSREITSFRTAFLAAVLMAVSPLVVFNSRLVKEDGLVQFFLLLAVYTYLVGGKRSWLSGIAAGLAALAKVMGIAVGFALSAVSFAESPRRLDRPLRIFGVSLLFAAIYPLYGLAIDAETYRRLSSFLVSTYSFESFKEKFLILPRMILEPRVSAVTPLIDGWLLLGWLSVLSLVRSRAVVVTFVCYLLALMMSVNSQNVWGFYLEPVLPFVCLGAALTVRRALSRLDVVSVFFVIALGFLPQYAAIQSAPRPFGFRGVAVLAFLPLIPAVLRLTRDHPLRRAGQALLAAMVVVGIVASLHRCVTTL
jgi:hypothetical protein